MKSYNIIITTDAENDLKLIYNYIANGLMLPDTAVTYIRNIRKKIASLSEMPERIKKLSKEPWHTRGVRNLIVNNFYIYFRIENDTNTVYILNVIYKKRQNLQSPS